MGKNKILLYTRDHDLQKILKKIALPYVSFRYNSTYELEVCNNMLGIYKSLNEPTTRVDYCCFYLEDEKELEIYKNIKDERGPFKKLAELIEQENGIERVADPIVSITDSHLIELIYFVE